MEIATDGSTTPTRDDAHPYGVELDCTYADGMTTRRHRYVGEDGEDGAPDVSAAVLWAEETYGVGVSNWAAL